jgi:hypothetical protein
LEEFLDGLLGDSLRDPPVRHSLREIGNDYSFWHLIHAERAETQVSAETEKSGKLVANQTGDICAPNRITLDFLADVDLIRQCSASNIS